MGPEDGWNKRISASDQRLEELRHIVAETGRAYKLAKANYDKAEEILKDVGGLGNPDGAFAQRKARQHYAVCFERYREALHNYSEFILGKSE